MSRQELADALAAADATVERCKQERAAAGFDTLAESKARLEAALTARRVALARLEAHGAA